MYSAPPFPVESLPDNQNDQEVSVLNGEVRQNNKRTTAAQRKATAHWQEWLWKKWPREEDWPGKLDVYEAAAYIRVSPDSIRRAIITGRDGKAELPHQRIRGIYRIRKIDLDALGAISGRS